MKILHFSDLHFGHEAQKSLWPTFKTALTTDIRRFSKKHGSIDLVIFSGDLVQSGSSNEYEQLSLMLQALWAEFRDLGFNPLFFPIPGNHDLVRPKDSDSAAVVLSEWDSKKSIHKVFWNDAGSDYRKCITASFANYSTWIGKLSEYEIPLPNLNFGLLPGDCSAQIDFSGFSLGLIGLNSAWLQLGDGNFKGKLAVNERQLLAVTGDAPDEWVKKNKFNLLLTHHPTDWLGQEALNTWHAEIYTASRFDAHLFGHMHEMQTNRASTNNSLGKLYIQSASLFGLEKVGSTQVDRRHGYSLLQLVDEPVKSIRHWPRKAHLMGDKSRKMIPDPDFYYDEDEEFCTHVLTANSEPSLGKYVESGNDRKNVVGIGLGSVSLSKIRLSHLPNSAHSEIRKAEQSLLHGEMLSGRPAWIVSDWGLGTDDFIVSVAERFSIKENIYRIELPIFSSRDDLLEKLLQQLGFPLTQLMAAFDQRSPSILILDELGNEGKSDQTRLEQELKDLTELILGFGAPVYVLICSRYSPISEYFSPIVLKELNEVDTAQFIKDHPLSQGKIYNSDYISAIYRNTDGIPARLETALEHVQLVGIKELPTTNPDVSGKGAGEVAASPALIAVLDELIRDPSQQLVLKLLKVLTLFPAGVHFNSVRRFLGTQAFYPSNAQALIDRALVDKVDDQSLGEIVNDDSAKILCVRRPVREYLYSIIPETEFKSLNRKALALYFGPGWMRGEIKSPPSLRLNNPKQTSFVINNALVLATRVLHDAAASPTKAKRSEAWAVANGLTNELGQGDHYRHTYIFCEDAMPQLLAIDPEADSSNSLAVMKINWAESARMLKHYDKARDIFISLRDQEISKSQRQSLELNLALVFDKLDEHALAVDAARRCKALDPKADIALQAEGVIVKNDPSVLDKEQALATLEAKARKRKAFIVANNFALSRAEKTDDPQLAADLAKVVSDTRASSSDFYNIFRADIIIAGGILKSGAKLEGQQLSRLIQAYHYLYIQRIDSLFNKCHRVLWKAFQELGQTDNLLRLYRYSSFLWRLSGTTDYEKTYLKDLRARFADQISKGITAKDSPEMRYFLGHALSEKRREDEGGLENH